MANVINATSTGNGGLVSTGDDSGILNIQTNETTAITVDASQNVGIGVTPSAFGSTNKAIENSAGCFFPRATTNLDIFQNTYFDGTNYKYKATGTAVGYEQWAGGGHFWYVAASGTAGNTITGFANPVMTLDSSGNLLVGTTAQTLTGLNDARVCVSPASNNNGFKVSLTNNLNLIALITRGYTTGGSYYHSYMLNGSEQNVGTISVSNTATAYNTSSDYRLKENIVPMTGALTKVAQLKPVIYKWKSDGTDSEGFIAHELAEVCPQAVTGEKDAVDANGKPVYQGIDTSFLVATLTAALQETKALIDTQAETINALTARIVALEGQ